MRKRLRSHEGANAVEFALVLPILLILVYGMITGGIAYNRKLQMNHAAREASRYAATLPQDADGDGTVSGGEMDAWFQLVFERLVETGSGEVNIGDPSAVLCVTFVSDDGSTDSRTVTGPAGSLPSPPPPTGGDDDCRPATSGVDDGLSGERVQVRTEREARLSTVFFSMTPRITADAIARFEDPPAPVPSPTSP